MQMRGAVAPWRGAKGAMHQSTKGAENGGGDGAARIEAAPLLVLETRHRTGREPLQLPSDIPHA
jgi:hypothetical protein